MVIKLHRVYDQFSSVQIFMVPQEEIHFAERQPKNSNTQNKDKKNEMLSLDRNQDAVRDLWELKALITHGKNENLTLLRRTCLSYWSGVPLFYLSHLTRRGRAKVYGGERLKWLLTKQHGESELSCVSNSFIQFNQLKCIYSTL